MYRKHNLYSKIQKPEKNFYVSLKLKVIVTFKGF